LSRLPGIYISATPDAGKVGEHLDHFTVSRRRVFQIAGLDEIADQVDAWWRAASSETGHGRSALQLLEPKWYRKGTYVVASLREMMAE
jgi:hypothetical protein